MTGSPEITQLLEAWAGGDREALDALMPIVLDELKRIAAAYMAREAHAQTLQTTALVNEAYLRLVKVRPEAWQHRTQFFALAAQIMRRILVDHARAQLGPQRGGDCQFVPLESALAIEGHAPGALMALDEALAGLEKMDPRKSRIVELRLFAGLTNEEVASAIGISPKTVMREWHFAKVWLARELNHRLSKEN
jgi:RNA polymerase sigma-70 factor, ECF subfamily